MKRINADLGWLVSAGGLVNAYVWNGDTLLDLGAPGLGKLFLYEAAQAGYATKNFANVLVSHCHVDHCGGLLHLHHDVSVYGSAHDLDVLAGAHPAPKYHPRFGFLVEAAESLIPRVQLRERQVAFPVAPGASAQGWIAVPMPGHTPGSLCWYQKETRTIFVGDNLINHFGIFTGPSPLFSDDYPLAIASLQKLRELEIETIIFGHGAPISVNAEKKLHGLLDRLQQRALRFKVAPTA